MTWRSLYPSGFSQQHLSPSSVCTHLHSLISQAFSMYKQQSGFLASIFAFLYLLVYPSADVALNKHFLLSIMLGQRKDCHPEKWEIPSCISFLGSLSREVTGAEVSYKTRKQVGLYLLSPASCYCHLRVLRGNKWSCCISPFLEASWSNWLAKLIQTPVLKWIVTEISQFAVKRHGVATGFDRKASKAKPICDWLACYRAPSATKKTQAMKLLKAATKWTSPLLGRAG